MGDFADADVESRIDDIKIVLETTFSKVNEITSISLFGLRFGEIIAAFTASSLNFTVEPQR